MKLMNTNEKNSIWVVLEKPVIVIGGIIASIGVIYGILNGSPKNHSLHPFVERFNNLLDSITFGVFLCISIILAVIIVIGLLKYISDTRIYNEDIDTITHTIEDLNKD